MYIRTRDSKISILFAKKWKEKNGNRIPSSEELNNLFDLEYRKLGLKSHPHYEEVIDEHLFMLSVLKHELSYYIVTKESL